MVQASIRKEALKKKKDELFAHYMTIATDLAKCNIKINLINLRYEINKIVTELYAANNKQKTIMPIPRSILNKLHAIF